MRKRVERTDQPQTNAPTEKKATVPTKLRESANKVQTMGASYLQKRPETSPKSLKGRVTPSKGPNKIPSDILK